MGKNTNNEKRICLNQSVLDFMASKINSDSFVLEFGSGYSSRWFADRCGRLLSIETDAKWANIVREDLVGSDCSYELFASATTPGVVQKLRRISNADLVLVDSKEDYRQLFSTLGWSVLKRGHWLVFDDAQRERHQKAVRWLSALAGPGIPLEWKPGDIASAVDRLALAFQKPLGIIPSER